MQKNLLPFIIFMTAILVILVFISYYTNYSVVAFDLLSPDAGVEGYKCKCPLSALSGMSYVLLQNCPQDLPSISECRQWSCMVEHRYSLSNPVSPALNNQIATLMGAGWSRYGTTYSCGFLWRNACQKITHPCTN